MHFLTFPVLHFILTFSLITNNSVDGIKIGSDINTSIQFARKRYLVKKEKLFLEGDAYPIYNIYKSGKRIYAIEPDENGSKIFRIWIYSSDFKTKSGIGVGSTLADIKLKYKIDYITTEGEGSIAVGVKGMSLGFILDNSKIPKNWWIKQDTKMIPGNIPIVEIII